MEHIWAPWRSEYLSSVDKDRSKCVFCHAAESKEDRVNLVLKRGTYNYIIMNRFPYTIAHCMIVPFEHIQDISCCSEDLISEMMKQTLLVKDALTKLYNPEGFNIGMNIGRVAGAGIDQHIHMHIVPRWKGDSNFITAIGETKVVSEKLHKTYQKIYDQLL